MQFLSRYSVGEAEQRLCGNTTLFQFAALA